MYYTWFRAISLSNGNLIEDKKKTFWDLNKGWWQRT
jgi:hypothetical protein